MDRGSAPTDDGHFSFDNSQYEQAISVMPEVRPFFHRAMGGAEFAKGQIRWVLKLTEDGLLDAKVAEFAAPILERVAHFRSSSKKAGTRRFADRPYMYTEDRHFHGAKIFVPQILSQRREFVTCGLLSENTLVLAPHFQLTAEEMYCFALISSRMHMIWIATVCGKLKTDFRYSNTLGWNTFPVPTLTEKNKRDLECCAEDILLAREANFPLTIGDLYDLNSMPSNVREAHERNDETLERIYIGRRFKNDTERLEKLFEFYMKMEIQAGVSKEIKAGVQ